MYSGSRAGENSCGTLLTENSTGLEKASRIICTLTTKRQGQQTKKQINEMDFAASSWRAQHAAHASCLIQLAMDGVQASVNVPENDRLSLSLSDSPG